MNRPLCVALVVLIALCSQGDADQPAVAREGMTQASGYPALALVNRLHSVREFP